MKKLILLLGLGLLLCLNSQPLNFSYAANIKTHSSSSTKQQNSKASDKPSGAKDSSKTNKSSNQASTNPKKETKNKKTEKKQSEKTQKSNSKDSQKDKNQQVKPQKKDTSTQNRSVQTNTSSKNNEIALGKQTDTSTDDNSFVEESLSADDWKIELKDNSNTDDFNFIKENQKTLDFFNNKPLVFGISISLIVLSFLGVIFFSLLYIRNSKHKSGKRKKRSAAHFRVF